MPPIQDHSIAITTGVLSPSPGEEGWGEGERLLISRFAFLICGRFMGRADFFSIPTSPALPSSRYLSCKADLGIGHWAFSACPFARRVVVTRYDISLSCPIYLTNQAEKPNLPFPPFTPVNKIFNFCIFLPLRTSGLPDEGVCPERVCPGKITIWRPDTVDLS